MFADNFSHAVNDHSSIRVTITNGSNWALFNYSWKVEPSVFRSTLPLSRGYLEREDKSNQEYNIYRNNYLLVKFWDLENMREAGNYTTNIFRNVNYTGTPNRNLRAFYCNDSYNSSEAIKVPDSSNCVL